MSEALTVPRLTMMTSTVSKESLARDTHTQSSTLKSSVAYNFENKQYIYFIALALLKLPGMLQSPWPPAKFEPTNLPTDLSENTSKSICIAGHQIVVA